MPASVRNGVHLALAVIIAILASAPVEAQPPGYSKPYGQQAPSPFAPYHRVAQEVFVTEPPLFTRYTGPDVTKWRPPEGDDSADTRKRLGVFSLAPDLKVYIDVVDAGLPTYYELRDVKSGRLIHRFEYAEGWDEGAVLLLNGRGIVYEYAKVKDYCVGMATRKFRYTGGKLIEVKQPYTDLEEAQTTTQENLTLYLDASTFSARVASLAGGTPVTILQRRTLSGSNWYLIRTPLGLTGWVPDTLPGSEQPTLKGLNCG